MKRIITTVVGVLLALTSYAQKSPEANQANEISSNRLFIQSEVPQAQISETARYLKTSANCRIAAVSFIAAGAAWYGLSELLIDDSNDSKSNNQAIGCCIAGGIALICGISDIIYYKKAATAAAVEIKPASSGLGLSMAF